MRNICQRFPLPLDHKLSSFITRQPLTRKACRERQSTTHKLLQPSNPLSLGKKDGGLHPKCMFVPSQAPRNSFTSFRQTLFVAGLRAAGALFVLAGSRANESTKQSLLKSRALGLSARRQSTGSPC